MENFFKSVREVNEYLRNPKLLRGRYVYANRLRVTTGVKTVKGQLKAHTVNGWVDCELSDLTVS